MMTNLTDRRTGRKLPKTVLMTDRKRLADPAAAIAALAPGSAVIFRHYDAENRPELADKLARLCRIRRLLFVVAGDPRLARAVNADGLHLPESLMFSGPSSWRLWRRPGWLVTAAAHGPAALQRAARLGVDAALLSPVFPTRSHPDGIPIGPLRFAAWAGRAPLPVYALGGVTRSGWRRLRTSGAPGWASIGGLTPPDTGNR